MRLCACSQCWNGLRLGIGVNVFACEKDKNLGYPEDRVFWTELHSLKIYVWKP